MVAENSSQLAEFVRLYLRLKPFRMHIPLMAAAMAILITIFWLVSYRPTYTSEAIALVRPQEPQPRREEVDETNSVRLFPKPLGVADYTLLMKSDSILSAVAQAYNDGLSKDDAEHAVSMGSLRNKLSATSRLEIKTPYAVNYYPTIEMRADDTSPERAYNLMQFWIQEVQKRAHEIAFSTKESVLNYLESEYGNERAALLKLEQELNVTMSESGQLIEALRLERAALEEAYEMETVTLLNQAEDEWDERVAEREAELNLPLKGAQVYAITGQIESLQASIVAKEKEFAEARARLENITQELQLYSKSPVADPESDLFWSVTVDADPMVNDQSAAADIQDVQIPTTGVNPVGVMLSRDASTAKITAASLPQELEQLRARVETMKNDVDESQTAYVVGDTEIANLTREKDAQLEMMRIQRRYGLENLQRESEILVLNLTRERQALEEHISRDLDTEGTAFASLGESRLQARLAVANTMDEFEVITGPSQPEARAAFRVLNFFLVTFLLALMLVSGAIIVAFVLSDTLGNLAGVPHGHS